MNIGSIAQMIRDEPEIVNDIPAFLERVNTKNIRQIDQIRTSIIEQESIVSLADRNGGEATEADVLEAIAYVQNEVANAG